MRITRRFTQKGQDVFDTVEWTRRTSRITNADGSVVFEMKDAEIPRSWSQLATDIMVSKYFRKAGVPQTDEHGQPMLDLQGRPITGPEHSARQVIHRLAGCWRYWGERHGYFDTIDDAEAFYDELSHMLLNQMAAPNSPQWFNTGLNWAYGISGPAQGHWIADPATGRIQQANDAYSHPQPHACFIQSVKDDLVNEDGIMDLWVREARLFKFGSGTGTNFSALRGEGELLSGGGKSSGLMSFLKIGDRAAGAIKSGGTTRRAAKMVCLDADHPDIQNFVNWKVREEIKVAALVEGLKHLPDEQQDVAKKLGLQLDYDFNGEAYYTVSGQNSNNSIRLTDAFFQAVENGSDWDLIRRTDGAVHETIKARDLWDQICYAAWRCADPGIQYDTTINAWHTCPMSGRINASNPCSEYMFLDDTACNLASINLLQFYDAENRTFQLDLFSHAIEVWTVVLEISVLMAAFPSSPIAEKSYKFRTLGLGFANLGAMLMQAGIPYDCNEARAVTGAITSILCGRSYATSALMAAEHGPFDGFDANRREMMRVIRNHRRAAHGVQRDADAYENLEIRPVPIDHDVFRQGTISLVNAAELLREATAAWDDALELGERHGFRNAQVTVIAPTGTIGLLMDCDTTGVEPDFALTKFKKLAGGGYFKIANQSLRPALAALGYDREQIVDILTYVMGTLSLDTPMTEDGPHAGRTFREFLRDYGYNDADLEDAGNQLASVFELGFAFSTWSMPEHVLDDLIDGGAAAARADTSFNGLARMGLTDHEIDALNERICGTQTIEGAPHLASEHLPVFDCANACGKTGTRFIRPEGHIRMMAAAQPFISGAISKTINLPHEASIDDIASAYWLSWELGLKANALYRDGSKLSQPLNSKSDDTEIDDDDDDTQDEEAVEAALGEVSNGVAGLASAISTSATSSDHHDDEVAPVVERIVEKIIERPMRRRLADTRRSVTHRFNVAGHEGYLTAGLYEDGTPGELFITMSKEGSTIGGLMDSLGTAISVALQYGVPVESLVKKFEHQRFEPMGMTTNRDIPFAKSLVDYIFRWLGMQFIPGYRDANAPARSGGTSSTTNSITAGSDRTEVKEDTKSWSEIDNDPTPAGKPGIASSATRVNEQVEGTPDASAGENRITTTVHRHSEAVVVRSDHDGSERMIAASSDAVMTSSALDRSNASMQGDAPACEVCGAITVRNGTCYRCLNCGNSMGCS